MIIHPSLVSAPPASAARTGAVPVVRPTTTPATAAGAPPFAVRLGAASPLLDLFRNPALGGLFRLSPQPRASFALPTLIAPTATPNDQTVFEEPKAGGKEHFLPTYKLATTGSGSQVRYAVSLAATSSGYLLTVKLADATAPALAANRVRMTPATRYFLSATLPGRTQTWDFPTASADGTSITLTMPITDPGVRDAIYQAMTQQSLQTKLVVRRTPALALPVPPAAPVAGKPPPQPLFRAAQVTIDTSLAFFFDPSLERDVFVNLPNATGGQPATLRPVTIPFPAGGAKSYSYWQDPLQPTAIYFLPDGYKIARLATSPHTPALGITTRGSDPATLNVTLTFLAIPVWDEARTAAAMAGPLQAAFSIPSVSSLTILLATTSKLLVNLPSADPTASNAPVPITNAIIDTATGIQGSVTLSLAAFQQVYNAMFVSPSVLLSGQVDVTVDDVTDSVPFSGRASEFAGEIFDSEIAFDRGTNQVTLTVRNAIESPVHVDALAATLLRAGRPTPAKVVAISPPLPVDLGPWEADSPPDPAAAVATAASTDGDGTAGTAAPSPGDDEAPATAPSATTAVASTAAVASRVAPPLSSLTLTLQLAPGQSFDPATDKVDLDTSQVTVNPDHDAIWNAIVEHQSVAPVKRPITLLLAATVFGPTAPPSLAPALAPTPPPPDASSSAAPALLAVEVVFANGQTVTFLPSLPVTGGFFSQTLQLNVDIAAYILGTQDSSVYNYRIDAVTAAGTRPGAWTTSNVDTLFLSLGV